MFWRWKLILSFLVLKNVLEMERFYSLLILKNVLEMGMVRANHFTKFKKIFSRNTPPGNNSRYAGLEVKKILSTVTKQRPKK